MTKKKRPIISRKTTIVPVDLAPLERQGIQLRDLRLLRSVCAMPLPGKENAIPELQQSIGVKGYTKNDPPMLLYEILFTLIGDFADGREGLRIQARYGLAYSVKSLEDITTDHINAFGHMVGINNTWPYWREFVQSMISRMNLPPLSLPLLRPDQLKSTTVQPPDKTNNSKKVKRKKK